MPTNHRLAFRGLAVLAGLLGVVCAGAPPVSATNAHAATSDGSDGSPAITTVAGGPGRGFATTVGQIPSALHADGRTLYVGDFEEARAIDLDTRYERVVAGAAAGSSPGGDGGLASDASVGNVHGFGKDPSGNLYLGEAGAVRRIDTTTGVIETVAGRGEETGDGPAASAHIEGLRGLVSDPAGNIYFTEVARARVRKIAPDGLVTTVAGTLGMQGDAGDGGPAATALLRSPQGLGLDDERGLLYVADQVNGKVRVINLGSAPTTAFGVPVAGGAIATVAGSGVRGYSGDRGPATAAHLNLPLGVVIDGEGNLFIADWQNARVRRVDAASGVIDTVTGASPCQSDPQAGCEDGRNTGDGLPATQAKISWPNCLAFDDAGNLHVCSGYYLRRVVPGADGMVTGAADEIIETFAGTGEFLSGDGGPAQDGKLGVPEGVAVDGAGGYYVAAVSRVRMIAAGAPRILSTVAGSSGEGFGGDGGPAATARLEGPADVVVHGSALLVADVYNARVRLVNMGGVPLTAYGVTVAPGVIDTVAGSGVPAYSTDGGGDGGPAVSATLSPYGLAVAPDGDLYVSDSGNHRIRKVEAATGAISTVAGNPDCYFPQFPCSSHAWSGGYGGDGGPATAAKLNFPSDLAFDARGNLYVADSDNNRVRMIDGGTRVISTVAGPGGGYQGLPGFTGDGGPATQARFLRPLYLVVDGGGNVLVSDERAQRVRHLVPGADGVVDGGADEIVTTVAGDGDLGPDEVGGWNGDNRPATTAKLSSPRGLAIDGTDLLIATNRRVRRVSGVAVPLPDNSPARPPEGDYDGDGTTDIAVFRPSSGTWFVHGGPTTAWGTDGDVPVPGDYDGDGTTDIAVFRPSSGTWFVHGGPTTAWGTDGDVPVPGDYDGDGTTDIAVFRPSSGTWFVHGGPTTAWGTDGDVPVPGDYDGDGTTDIAVFRPSSGTWFVHGGPTTAWGTDGDVPVPGDYDGDGTTDIAVFRPSSGTWFVHGGPTTAWGTDGDVPVPGDYDGDGTTDIAVFRPSSGTWFVHGGPTTAWGNDGDVALP